MVNAIEAQTPCVNCGGTAFIREEDLLALVHYTGTRLGRPVVPLVVLACSQCGVLRLFDAGIVGAT